MLANPDVQAIDGPGLTGLCDAIATAVVAHVIANGLVTVTVATTGTATAQAGGGTGTIS